MTAHDVFRVLHMLNVQLHPYPNGALSIQARPGTMTPKIQKAFVAHQAALHGLAEAWEERAAIAEYCGGLSRADAERVAWRAFNHAWMTAKRSTR